MNFLSILLPVHEPLLIFIILVGIILVSPFLFRLMKIPDVASFIIMGIFVGPHGLNILSRDASIELLGTVGLLYIMFLAGLELDSEKLKVSRKNSIVFGLATFLIPFFLGLVVSKTILQLEYHATLLVSIMFATHTLITYPIVRKLGVNRDISVLTAVGGTIITDTLVLLIFSVITKDFNGNSVGFEIIKLLILFGIYIVLIFYLFPKIARWFFNHIKRDRPVHYLFVLFMVCLAAYIAELIGVESIIGAFLAGLALNKSIPRNSFLMHHIEFVGNVLFIPVFLIGIGMLINIKVLLSSSYLWYVAVILIIAAFTGKWLAAFLSQKILRFNSTQQYLLFGLTSSHAAATLAIILIGYEKQMIDITIFNATVLIILFSSIASSFITEVFGKKLALTTVSLNNEIHPERILVPISNPATMNNLVTIANIFNAAQSAEPVFVLNIINENKSSREMVHGIRHTLEENVSEFNHLHENLKVITRVDLGVSSGIIRAAKEYLATDIVFGWGLKDTTSKKIFGNVFDHLMKSEQTLYAVNLKDKISRYMKYIIHIPANLEYEPVFKSIIKKLDKLARLGDQVIFRIENKDSLSKIKDIIKTRSKYNVLFEQQNLLNFDSEDRTIHVCFLLRKLSVSHSTEYNAFVQNMVANKTHSDYIIVVPGSA